MLGKIVAGSTVICAVVLWILLIKTSPASAGPIGILAVFALMYMSALGLLTFLLYGINVAAGRVIRMVTNKSQPKTFTLRKSYYYASVVALAPVMLIAMQSVNEIGVYQLLLVAFFVVTAWIYITKRTT